MEFSRQEYWSGLPFPSPGDLPNPGIEPGSPALQVDALPSEPPGNPSSNTYTKAYTQSLPEHSWELATVWVCLWVGCAEHWGVLVGPLAGSTSESAPVTCGQAF